MPDNTFDTYRESRSTARGIITAGIVVLIVAALAALAAAWYALSTKPDDAPEDADSPAAATVTVTAPPQSATELTGTYSGHVSSATAAEAGDDKEWTMMVTFGGNTATLGYPQSGCFVYLSEPVDDAGATVFKASPVSKKCSADGTWSFRPNEDGLYAEYSEGSDLLVTGQVRRD